jgi:hypothetical protein
MKPGAFAFSGRWLPTVKALGETGMGYTVVSVTLNDGRTFEQALIDSGYLCRVRGLATVPFAENDITDIKATHKSGIGRRRRNSVYGCGISIRLRCFDARETRSWSAVPLPFLWKLPGVVA